VPVLLGAVATGEEMACLAFGQRAQRAGGFEAVRRARRAAAGDDID
jgi:hypothetical protein